MGQMRNAINKLAILLSEITPESIKTLEAKNDKICDRVEELGRKADEGFDLIVMHLTEKFRKEGSNIKDQSKTPLKDVMDSGLASLVKGVVQWHGDIKKLLNRLDTDHQANVSKLLKTIQKAGSEAAKVKTQADKKLKKLFKSKKYKNKIKVYLDSLDKIISMVKDQTNDLKNAAKLRFDDAWVDRNFKISANMTVGDMVARSSVVLSKQMQEYQSNRAKAKAYVREWRDEYKGLAGQLATMKKWQAESEEMEEEAETVG